MHESKMKYSWQQALSDLITDPKELLEILELDLSLLNAARAAAQIFPLKVPRGFVARMQKGNVNDPLLQQILPLKAELQAVMGYSADPLQESQINPLSGLLHKYHGRVLVTLTSACAVHCRYCFRRHFPYASNNPGRRGWDSIFAYIAKDKTITEVIISGGDPLAVSDQLLKAFCEQVTQISHVKRLRLHTRLPIVLPERITPSFLELITALTLTPIVVIHANHPLEIHASVKAVLLDLKNAGVQLLNQTVLLKGINDDLATLINLSETLFDAGVLPYYLHLLDKVAGAAHFDLADQHAYRLHQALSERLPGYLVPRLVRDEAGKPAKTVLEFAYV